MKIVRKFANNVTPKLHLMVHSKRQFRFAMNVVLLHMLAVPGLTNCLASLAHHVLDTAAQWGAREYMELQRPLD